MDLQCRHVNDDPLGFSRQTATMLVGLGAGDLIPQFRKRNISSQALTALNKQDLMILGADESLADHMLRELRAAARKYGGRDLSEELRTKQMIKILMCANQQLNLIETFFSYARLRLVKDPKDFIIDSRKKERASQALCKATDCIIADIDSLERSLRELASEFPNYKPVPKTSRLRLIRFLTGIGFVAGLVWALRHGIVLVRKT